MNLPDTFSRRKRLQMQDNDVYQYATISLKLALQILLAFERMAKLSEYYNARAYDMYRIAERFMCEEIGVEYLSDRFNVKDSFEGWFKKVKDISEEDLFYRLDAMEIFCEVCCESSSKSGKLDDVKSIIDLINGRMQEQAFGYQLVDNKIIELTSTYAHKEMILPALSLLSKPKFVNAENEFIKAHEEFRNKHYEDCLIQCCKSLESVIKVIADEEGWGTSPHADFKTLLKAVYDNQLVPSFMQNQFNGLRSVLEGVATVRNKMSGHGAGIEQRKVSKGLASYQMNQTAAALIFIVDCAQ